MGSGNSTRTQGQPAAGAAAAKPALPAGWTAAQVKQGGRIEHPKGLEKGVTGLYVRPPPPPPVAAPVQQPNMRAVFADVLAGNRGSGGSSRDPGGYTTSGRGWGGNSSASSGYGMGGRNW